MRTRRVGLREVAQAAGVSVTTASDALNGAGRLTDATRARVQEAAQQLGYGPNAMARSLVGGRTNLVALALSYAEGVDVALSEVDYVRQAIIAATGRAQQLGLGLMLGPPTRHPEMWMRLPMDGLVVLSPVRRDPLLRIMREAGVPIVVVGRAPDDPDAFPCVDNDQVGGTAQVLDHLRDQGAQQIGLLTPELDDSFTDDCLAGYRAWCADRGVRENVQHLPPFPFDQPGRIDQLLTSPDRPDAIHAPVWEAGVQVVHRAELLGIRVPQDLLVSACGDTDPTPGSTGVTSLKLFPELAATAALDMLSEWTSTGDRPDDQIIKTELVVRASTSSDLGTVDADLVR